MRKSRFTLIEMLTVLVVIVILFGIGIPAIRNAITKKAPEGGTRMMNRMIELTRQYAITKNTRVALMMPTDVYNGKATDDDTYTYKAFEQQLPDEHDIGLFPDSTPDTPGIIMRPAIVDASDTFVKWVEDTEWTIFPPSTYFASKTGLTDITYTETIADSHRVIANGTVKALVFKANGSLANSTVDGVVYVKPFSTGVDDDGNYGEDSGGGDEYDPGVAHRYMITINWLTGKITTIPDTESNYVGTH